MKKVFADSFYWIALINLRDQWRDEALKVSKQLSDTTIVTTDEVLTETLNYFANSGKFLRHLAIENIDSILLNQNVDVISCRHEIVLEAIALYGARLDQGYSLTDCISMIVMQEFRIGEILSHDEHFVQEGFKTLL
jgi:predicted nucleic acid-binding protein